MPGTRLRNLILHTAPAVGLALALGACSLSLPGRGSEKGPARGLMTVGELEEAAQQRAREAARQDSIRTAAAEAEREAQREAKEKREREAAAKQAREAAERAEREELRRRAQEEAERIAREEAAEKARLEAEERARVEAEQKARAAAQEAAAAGQAPIHIPTEGMTAEAATPPPAAPAAPAAPERRMAPPAPVAREQAAAPRPAQTQLASSDEPTRGPMKMSPGARKISLNLLETNIRDVIAAFHAYSGRDFLLGEGADGKTITADIRNQPWDVALEQVLYANNLIAEEHYQSGMVTIRGMDAARELAKNERPEPEIFRLSYTDSKDVASVLGEMLGDDQIQITSVDNQNALLVWASPISLERVTRMIHALDVRRPTVSIQATIVSIARSDMESLGFQYTLEDPSKEFKGAGTQVMVKPSGILTNTPPILLNRKGDASLSTFLKMALSGTPYSLTQFIDAMKGASLAEVESKPVITTMSDVAASIEVGDAFHVPTMPTAQSGQGGQGGGGVSGGGRDVIRVGIMLNVTPSVTNNGKIRLKISAKRSGGEIGTDGTVKESFQSANSEMIVNDGETAVIGGLSLEERSRGSVGVPVLKDLPVFGRLFRTENMAHGVRDVLILVTPKIVEFPDDVLNQGLGTTPR